MGKKSVLLAGATGLVGSECLKLLLRDKDISSVRILTRRSIGLQNPKVEECISDFQNLELHNNVFQVDAIICALGTTIKKAGTKENFRLVDYEYPLQMAKLGIKNDVKHFLLISSIGANPKSKVFYTRTKGELEEAIRSLNFESVTIVRPSLLLGERKEYRFGEEIGKWFKFLFPKKYKPIEAKKVAEKLVEKVKDFRKGYIVLESSEMNK